MSIELNAYWNASPVNRTRRRRYDASFLPRPPVFARDRQLDPAEVLLEAGAPDHVRHVEGATVVEQRQAIANPNRPGGHALVMMGGKTSMLRC